MHVLIAPSGFKESLSAPEVAACMQTGVRRALPWATTTCLPLVDGGEGFTHGLTGATNGTITTVSVTGPVGQPVKAPIGILGGPGPRTAVVELAAAAGLSLVPVEQRNPLLTTSYGFGELVAAALDLEPERLLIGLGDSGVNDGGAGMAQALGAVLTDASGRPLPHGGGALQHLHNIDDTDLDPRLRTTPIDVACNPYNLLCGPRGVANVFAPQKGATPEQVQLLSRAHGPLRLPFSKPPTASRSATYPAAAPPAGSEPGSSRSPRPTFNRASMSSSSTSTWTTYSMRPSWF